MEPNMEENVGSFTEEQKSYLEFHRTLVFGMFKE